MRISTLFNMTFLMTNLLASTVVWANPAGTVTFKSGDATIVRADNTTVAAEKNTALNAGDTIETREGRLQLALIDGGKVSLQPNTTYKINKYEFSGKEDGSEYAFTELVKGGLRTISGLIGHKNRDRYQLKTAVATIGIRGTEFTVNFNDNVLLMTTNHGSVDVCNQNGCLNAVTGQTIAVSGPGAAPKPSDTPAKAVSAAPTTIAPIAVDSAKAVFATSDTVRENGLPEVTKSVSNASPVASPNVNQPVAGVVNAIPAVNLPAITTTTVNTPIVNAPAVTVPVVNNPAVITPVVITPPVSVPAITLPSVAAPVTLPSVAVPVVTVPVVTTPVVTSPVVTTPVVTVPTITLPSIVTPVITTPVVTIPLVVLPLSISDQFDLYTKTV